MDELKQALEQQKLNGIEEDYVEVLARALEIPRAQMARVMYAYQSLAHEAIHYTAKNFPVDRWDAHLSRDLGIAIERAMIVGAFNVALAHAIKSGGSVDVPVEALLPPTEKKSLCRGCPEALQCLAENLSTPEACYSDKKKFSTVYPIKISKNTLTVQARQPAGTYDIPLDRLHNHIWKMRTHGLYRNHYDR